MTATEAPMFTPVLDNTGVTFKNGLRLTYTELREFCVALSEQAKDNALDALTDKPRVREHAEEVFLEASFILDVLAHHAGDADPESIFG